MLEVVLDVNSQTLSTPCVVIQDCTESLHVEGPGLHTQRSIARVTGDCVPPAKTASLAGGATG